MADEPADTAVSDASTATSASDAGGVAAQGGGQNASSDAEGLREAGQKALETERTARREAERARKVAERELEKMRQQGMSDTERAVSDAEARGRTAAQTEFAERITRSEFTAAAARRNPTFDTTSMVDDLNLTRFIGEDGEPDTKAIAKAVERLVPIAEQAPTFDGGARRSASAPTSMSDFIRQEAARK